MATYYWVGGDGVWDASSTANWSLTSGGLPGVAAPNNTDTVIFDSASGAGTCTTISGSACATATLNSATLAVTLGADHTMSGNFTLTLGTLSLVSYKLTCNTFISSNSNIRTVDFGTGDITVTGNSTAVISFSTGTNAVFAGTPTFNCTYSGATGTRTITISSVIENRANINITAGTDIVTLGSSYANSVNFTGFSGSWTNSAWRMTGNLTISTGMTVSAGTSGVIFLGTSGTQQITTNGKTLDFPITQNGVGGTVQLQDNLTMGSTRTFTLTNGALDLNNLVLSTGAANLSNTNTRSIAFGTGKVQLTGSGITVLIATANTGLTLTGSKLFEATYSGAVGTRTFAMGSAGSGATEANAINLSVTAGTDIVTFSVGRSLKNLDFTGFAGTLATNSFTLYGGLVISNTMTLPSAAINTIFAATSGTQQITTNGVLLDFNLSFNGVGGTFAFQDALTQGSTRVFTITNGTVQLKNGVTSTVGVFFTSGTDQKFLQSTTPGSTATLSQASGTVNASYLTIKDITAIGGATFNARTDLGSKDLGNNTGWNFIYIAIQQILKPIMAKILKPIILN